MTASCQVAVPPDNAVWPFCGQEHEPGHGCSWRAGHENEPLALAHRCHRCLARWSPSDDERGNNLMAQHS